VIYFKVIVSGSLYYYVFWLFANQQMSFLENLRLSGEYFYQFCQKFGQKGENIP